MLNVMQEYRERLYRELRMYGHKDVFNKGFFLAKVDKVAKEMEVDLKPNAASKHGIEYFINLNKQLEVAMGEKELKIQELIKERDNAEAETAKQIFSEIDELIAQHSRGDIDDKTFYREIKVLKSTYKEE